MNMDDFKQIGIYIEQSKSCLNEEQIDAVLDYYNHGEYEMAFEGLMIELISNNCYPDCFSFTNWLQVGENCKINLYANFDDTIWNRFLEWAQLYEKQKTDIIEYHRVKD